MAYNVFDDALGFIDLYLADTVGPGPLVGAGTTPTSYGRFNSPGTELRATDPALGGGTFVFARAGAGITATQVCELSQTAASAPRVGQFDVSAIIWAGAVNTGKPLAVAMTTLTTGQWGWFQVQGIAITTCQGAPVAGNPAYWQAAGVVSPSSVASKAVLNAQFVSAPAVTVASSPGQSAPTTLASAALAVSQVLSATQALVLLNRPCAQGPIT